jgi:hypothetical protein
MRNGGFEFSNRLKVVPRPGVGIVQARQTGQSVGATATM